MKSTHSILIKAKIPMYSQTTGRLWALLESLFRTQVSVVLNLRTQLPVMRRLLREMPNLSINLRMTPSADSTKIKSTTKRSSKTIKKIR